MNKEIIKKIIIENQEFLKIVKPKKRDYKLEKNSNYIIVGPRRAGKSFFLYYHLINNLNLNSSKILYINFEDERLLEFTVNDFDFLIQCYKELYNQNPVFFFDEIQIIPGWEKFIRRLSDTKQRVFVTGSNANMLSSEIATTLGGRFMILEIHPLSFIEFLEFRQIQIDKNILYTNEIYTLKTEFNQFINFGGFPEVLDLEFKKDYLSSLYQKVFYGDIMARYEIKNDTALKLLVKKAAESLGNETSFNRIKNILKSLQINVGTSTLIDYYKYLNNSFLVFNISNYHNNLTEKENKKKFYFIDNGILNLFLNNQPQQLLENLVYTHLRRKFESDIFYLHKNIETDFYLPANKLLIQVTLEMSNIETKKREINSLIKNAEFLNLKKGLILTNEETENLTVNGIEINIMPVWKWLLFYTENDFQNK